MLRQRLASVPRVGRNTFNAVRKQYIAEETERLIAQELQSKIRRLGTGANSNGRQDHAAREKFADYRTHLYANWSAIKLIASEYREVLAFLRTGDSAVALRLRKKFGLVPSAHRSFPLKPKLLGSFKPPDDPKERPTIIVPVFDAFEQTAELFDILSDTARSASIILVNDCSEDPRIAPLCQSFAEQQGDAFVLTNSENKGFVHSVNRGISALKPGGHVILLNTDTVPPADWIARLLAPVENDPDIASVTPLSNNAEILSVPAPGVFTDPDRKAVTEIDRIAWQLSPDSLLELPTGIGFCMAMNRSFVDRIGSLDIAFGRGYGEEVDWCQKASALGGKNVAAQNLFVGHHGGASFGNSVKAESIRQASQIIAKRYPDYDQSVQDWIDAGPVDSERLALGIAWLAAASETPVPIFLAHSFGGGAEAALQTEIDLTWKAASGAIVLRVGGRQNWQVELHGAGFLLAGETDSNDLVHQLLHPIQNRRVVYSCGVGAADPVSVPKMICKLASVGSLEIRLHDFFPISPSWNLLDSKGRYQGVPDISNSDPAHGLLGIDGGVEITHAEWRDLWSNALGQADTITAFSRSSADLLAKAYPDAADKILIKPHDLPPQPSPLERGGQSVGVLGGINLAKGGRVLQDLAGVTQRRIVVIGELNGVFRLAPPHHVHGRYDRSQITELAQLYDVGVWLIPSICPETFSFATHEALATGLPVIGFRIGAQGEALSNAANGFLADDPSDPKALSAKIEHCFVSD